MGKAVKSALRGEESCGYRTVTASQQCGVESNGTRTTQSVTQAICKGRRRELIRSCGGRAFERLAKPVGRAVNPLAAGRSRSSRRWLEMEWLEATEQKTKETRQCWRCDGHTVRAPGWRESERP